MSYMFANIFFPMLYFIDAIETHSSTVFWQHFIVDCLTPKAVRNKAKEISRLLLIKNNTVYDAICI